MDHRGHLKTENGKQNMKNGNRQTENENSKTGNGKRKCRFKRTMSRVYFVLINRIGIWEQSNPLPYIVQERSANFSSVATSKNSIL